MKKRRNSGLPKSLLALVLLAALHLSFGSLAKAQWTYTASMPATKEMHATAALDGFVYVLGGVGPSAVCYRYEIATNVWTTIASMSVPVSYPSAAAYNGRVYVTGGYAGCCGGTETNALQIYDPATNTWSLGATMPATRAAHGSAFLGGKLYVVGGSIGATLYNTLFEYDPILNTWTTRAPMSVARYQVTAEAANGKLYASGGYSGTWLTTHEEYDPLTNVWTTRAAMPLGKYLHAGGSVMDGAVEKVFICGGYSGGWHNTCRIYDPTTNTWSALSNLLVVRGRTSGAGYNNCIYMPGGTNGTSATLTNESTCLAAVLPVGLLFFEAYVEESTVHLNWAFGDKGEPVASEVQRSLDGHTFETIAKVDGAKVSLGQSYFHQDQEGSELSQQTTVYYRLRMHDEDGAIAHSDVVSIRLQQAGFSASGHPNPVQDRFTCEIMSHEDPVIQFWITDALGREVMSDDFITFEGHNSFDLDLDWLPAGAYFMQLKGQTGHQLLRFVKE
jgi:N-acetylneuraminic acid mutarotase